MWLRLLRIGAGEALPGASFNTGEASAILYVRWSAFSQVIQDALVAFRDDVTSRGFPGATFSPYKISQASQSLPRCCGHATSISDAECQKSATDGCCCACYSLQVCRHACLASADYPDQSATVDLSQAEQDELRERLTQEGFRRAAAAVSRVNAR